MTSTQILETPAASLAYDVHGPLPTADGRPPLLLIGHPMDAGGFATLAELLPDRTVVTYDPRGLGRSSRHDGRSERTPEDNADDVHRIIAEIGGPVDLFASSGGAVNALALVARHPQQVRTLVAHEPPALTTLPDREQALAAVLDIRRTYEESGAGPGMVKFITAVGLKGEVPANFADLPMPDPAEFGMSADDDGSRDDALLGQNLLSCTHYEPDFEALRAASARVVLAAGEESEGQLAARAAHAVAKRLGTTPVLFPSGHGGFLGGEYGQAGKPEAFAVRLREVLSGQA